MIYYLIPIRMDTIKEKEKKKYWPGCGEIGTVVHY